MYALRDAVGEERLNRALSRFLSGVAFQEPHNEVAAATYTERPDGTFLVRLEVEAHKLRADGDGVESEIRIDDWIDIAVFGGGEEGGEAAETVLFLEKRHIHASQAAFEIVVDRRPVRAGIDPYNKLIDRDSGDSVLAVSAAER